MTARHLAVIGNIALLEQGLEALERLGPAHYGARGRHADTSSIGAHVRHVLDHYQAFFGGLGHGRIDYDERERDAALATDPERAAEAMRGWIGRLEALAATRSRGDSVIVKGATPPDGSHAPTEWTFSSVERELAFLQSHTIHHYALIALLAKDAGVDLGPAFGLAPSTLAYRRLAACAR